MKYFRTAVPTWGGGFVVSGEKAGQAPERLLRGRFGNLFPVDLERREDGLVEEPPRVVIGLLVRPIHPVRQRQRGVQSGFNLIKAHRELPDRVLCSDALAPHPRVFLGEQLFGHLVREVRCQQLLLLLLEACKLLLGFFAFKRFFPSQLAESDSNFGCERCALRLRQRDGCVVRGDRLFDRSHPVIRLAAAIELPASAEEVFVRAALAFGRRKGEPTPTFAADEASREVVMMSPGPLSVALQVEHVLDHLKGPLIDKWLVPPGVDVSAVAHDSQVVVAAQ